MTDSNETLNSFHTTNLATTATFSSKSLSPIFCRRHPCCSIYYC